MESTEQAASRLARRKALVAAMRAAAPNVAMQDGRPVVVPGPSPWAVPQDAVQKAGKFGIRKHMAAGKPDRRVAEATRYAADDAAADAQIAAEADMEREFDESRARGLETRRREDVARANRRLVSMRRASL